MFPPMSHELPFLLASSHFPFKQQNRNFRLSKENIRCLYQTKFRLKFETGFSTIGRAY